MRKFLLGSFGVFVVLVWAAATAAPGAAQAPDDWIMYVGTYTRAPSKGIYAYRHAAGGRAISRSMGPASGSSRRTTAAAA